MVAPRSVALFIAVVFVTVSHIAGDYCLGYTDLDGEWHEGFDCDGLLDGGDNCCGTLTDKYCCFDEDKSVSAGIIALIVSLVIVVAVCIICVAVCVCCCNACRGSTTTTTYIQQPNTATPTAVTAQSSQMQSSVSPGVGYMPTAASNPMTQYQPVYAQGDVKAPEY
ncbi:uncharacterized protein LOC102803136 [Saccoglossus kowalevskii]|uniref:Protein shisa-4-like n=1 Tax=Saccoglossus kowalevskii TaxID=10224 RepID=A0ABM0MU19_SACKO|nr:PREDICTED: protein shisa-4-like [Saccoglossus kowalevskii]